MAELGLMHAALVVCVVNAFCLFILPMLLKALPFPSLKQLSHKNAVTQKEIYNLNFKGKAVYIVINVFLFVAVISMGI